MDTCQKKLLAIQQLINMYNGNFSIEKRAPMYGSVEAVELQWTVLDQIYFVLEDVGDIWSELDWGAFLAEKGFGSKSAALTFAEEKTNAPYSELIVLRKEYEEWRSKKLSLIKEKLKSDS
jgi:hypothetical protein